MISHEYTFPVYGTQISAPKSKSSYPSGPETYSPMKLLKRREISWRTSPSSFHHVGFSPSAIRSFRGTNAKIDHEGCINTAKWNGSGDILVTGSDDRTVKIWSLTSSVHKVNLKQTVPTMHRGNIFAVEFSLQYPDRILTAAADGNVCVNYLQSTNIGTKVHTSDDIM